MAKGFTMKIEYRCLCLLCLLFAYTTSQYIPTRPKSCVGHNTILVERFFSVMFAEFHTTPPVCVCVQMCLDQPTYCYPNGCFKTQDKVARAPPVSSIQHDGTKRMFLVDSQKDFMKDVLLGVPTLDKGKMERAVDVEPLVRPNPFRERVFKYKRVPKLQMKYNLREQVKNTKDIKMDVDVSKTRWPTNKQMNKPYKTNIIDSPSNYFMSGVADVPESNFKRYITKRENQNSVGLTSLYLYKIDASNFSLESLIDNLTEGGLVLNNITLELKTDSNFQDVNGDNKTGSEIVRNSSIVDNLDETTLNKIDNLANNISDTSSINSTAGGNERNRDKEIIDTFNSTKTSYSDMINVMSKAIEKQNNASMEVMERLFDFNKLKELVTNGYILNTDPRLKKMGTLETTTENMSFVVGTINSKLQDRNVSGVELTTIGAENGTKSTYINPITMRKQSDTLTNSNKKSKQRIVRKLRNKKLN